MPTGGPVAAPEAIVALAGKGEELGFGFVAVSDHVVVPRAIRSRYPYDVSGEFDGGGECLEQLALLSFVAAHTSTMRLLPSVMVLPHRGPVLAAKMLATSDAPTFEGRYVNFSDVGFVPRPVQEPHPPIWVGGESLPALRRAGRLGDGWYPSGNNARNPIGAASLIAGSISSLRRFAEEAGRDPTDIDIACTAEWSDERDEEPRPEDGALTFTGSAEEVAAGIRTFEGLGVGHMTFELHGRSLDETLERMERFAVDVMPLV